MYSKIKSNKILKFLFKLTKYLVSFIILYLLIHTQEINLKNLYDSNLSIHIFCIIIFLNFVEFFISGIRFSILLLSQNIYISMKYIIIWTLQGRFLDSFMPSSFGGDAIKIYYLNKYLKENNKNNISNNLLFSTIITLADKAFALCGLFLLSSIFFLFKFSTNINMQNYKVYIIISLSITLIFLFFIILSINPLFLNSNFVNYIKNIKYIGSLFNECLNIMQRLALHIKHLFSILFLSILNQFISLLSLLVLIISSSSINFINVDYNFIISFFLLLPIFFFTNILGVFGGFGIGTLSIGFCLVNFLNIENGYELIFLSQSINFLARLLCIFSYIKYEKYRNFSK